MSPSKSKGKLLKDQGEMKLASCGDEMRKKPHQGGTGQGA